MSEVPAGHSRLGAVLRVTSGNFLEMFDFFLFGFYATYIAKTFFPVTNEYASLMLTFGTFGVGFLMRPLGAIILGAYIDRVGRRQGLIVTLALMALGTVLIAFVPGYDTIGLLAPFLVLTGRLFQGFSAGVELGGVSVYLSEMATPGHKGFYVAWQSASQQLAIIVAAAIGYVTELGLDRIAQHENDLLDYANQRLAAIPSLRQIGTAANKAAVFSFVMECAHPHDIAQILDNHGVAVRAGHHCAQPLMERFGVPATARASFGLYNTRAEVDALAAALEKVEELFGR